jgi:hypothetical protein
MSYILYLFTCSMVPKSRSRDVLLDLGYTHTQASLYLANRTRWNLRYCSHVYFVVLQVANLKFYKNTSRNVGARPKVYFIVVKSTESTHSMSIVVVYMSAIQIIHKTPIWYLPFFPTNSHTQRSNPAHSLAQSRDTKRLNPNMPFYACLSIHSNKIC